MYKELIPPQSRVKRWIREWDDLGMLITDFSYWTQGDLQVLMEPRDDNTCRRLHFRTISTNEVHPKPATPYIDLFKADYPVWEHCNSISYEDRVAYAFWEERGMSRVGAGLVLDSKESKVIMPYIPLSDLSFLSRDEALLLFNGQEGRGVGLGVYSFPLQRVVCECRFPFTDPLNRIAFLTRPESRFGDKCPSSIARTILPDQEVNILAMTFRLGYFSNPACCVLALQLFSNMYKSLLKDHPGREAFEWEEWGPTVTRWLPYQKVMPTGNRSIFGSRMLAWGEPAWLDGSSRFELSLILLDFNPRPIKRGATTNTEGESHEIVVAYETSWDFDPGTHPPLKSSLPFRAFAFPWFPSFPYFRFDGSTILAKGPEKYQFWSFLPLESMEEPEKGEQAENTVS
ncbi:hypothetical protein CPB86DRAFT_748261 [Serendipita vermifera]|nr:hypothetical protein CPB86DRAFT_748261 [Serendipita vermifera]